MIAAVIALAGVCAALAGLSVTTGIWLHSANTDRLNAADLIDGQRKLVAEFKSKYETEFAKHSVTQRELEQAVQLKAVAEKQRNDAEARVHDLLRSHVKGATEDEIRELVTSVFAIRFDVVPAQPARADSGADRLLRPGDEL